MPYTYIKKTSETGWIYIERSDGVSIPLDKSNSDYQEYLAINEPNDKL
jgi:hypothetical protein